MSPTETEWDVIKEYAGGLLSYHVVQKLYEGRDENVVDDLLDGKIPRRYIQEVSDYLNPQAIMVRRVERLMDRFEKTVEKLLAIPR